MVRRKSRSQLRKVSYFGWKGVFVVEVEVRNGRRLSGDIGVINRLYDGVILGGPSPNRRSDQCVSISPGECDLKIQSGLE